MSWPTYLKQKNLSGVSNLADLPPNADPLTAEKWKKLLSRVWLFNFISFIDFVLVAGSMAMGNPKEDSDFDVIIGVRKGRIFTVRFFCYMLFGIFGWRRKRSSGSRASKDRFCFSHFVTPEKYCLSGPYNEYWKKLYLSLVPVYGSADNIQKFYDANAGWTCPVRNSLPIGSFGPRLRASAVSNGMKWVLSGKLGDVLEKLLKKIQIAKIEKSLIIEKQYKPRIIFNDTELEFHPHTKRIEEYVGNSKIE